MKKEERISNYENEIKILINETQYEHFLKTYPCIKTIFQTNYYYDTADFQLYKNGYTCRVRIVEDKIKLQLKEPDNSQNPLYKTRKETTKEFKAFPDIQEIRKLANNPNLKFIGKLVTTRFFFNTAHNIEFVIDKNTYFNTEDYEIEIEFNSESELFLIKTFLKSETKIDIPICKSIGKYSRFVNIYRNFNNI